MYPLTAGHRYQATIVQSAGSCDGSPAPGIDIVDTT
jgi:hypothetical protein